MLVQGRDVAKMIEKNRSQIEPPIRVYILNGMNPSNGISAPTEIYHLPSRNLWLADLWPAVMVDNLLVHSTLLSTSWSFPQIYPNRRQSMVMFTPPSSRTKSRLRF